MLRDRTRDAFDRAGEQADELARAGADVTAGRELLQAYRDRLAAPMRVALVGRISSGKSTLANALLGCKLVATGIEELTFNVNWLRHASESSLVVHFRDGSARTMPLAELERVTVRRDEHRELLASIDFIEVFFDNEQLIGYDLIDTPGIDSHFGEDSANTLRFLRRTGADVRNATFAHSRGADALLLVFGRNISETDFATLADIQGSQFAALTPVTAIGVLTKVEDHWPSEPDPMASGRRVAGRLMGESEARRLLYDIRPVCSLVGAVASTFTPGDLEALSELAKVPPDRLETLAKRGRFFGTREYDDVSVPPVVRKEIFARFGGWGIVLATRLIRDGAASEEELRTQLLEQSGMTSLRALIATHFGNRSHLIKLQQVATDVRTRSRTADPATTRILAEVDSLTVNEHGFAELAALRDYYQERLTLTDAEAGELLRATGEHGIWVTQRLGLAPDATLDQMYARARERLVYWRERHDDPLLSGPTKPAVRTLRRSYELLVYHVGEARRHLELLQ